MILDFGQKFPCPALEFADQWSAKTFEGSAIYIRELCLKFSQLRQVIHYRWSNRSDDVLCNSDGMPQPDKNLSRELILWTLD
ncbi:hypothetical protein [Nostoc sp. 'Peltigera malacea cyanobiont' DB3992]|uniref:hypothetical protein n=1 Tax=Nostoc sp. 'Peltigera malacea cyanobiont' DB3992 TaxID=1206980 RepID=UPI00211EBA36|nr:hypothetical protein [Nostoc sp. 'Peltigera malacea cyanobiont' DB3992]